MVGGARVMSEAEIVIGDEALIYCNVVLRATYRVTFAAAARRRELQRVPERFFFQAEDGIRDGRVTGVQTCALPICELGGVDLVVGTVEKRDADARHLVPGEDAELHGLLRTGVHRRDVLLRDTATGD